jgi:hypothetical protein
MDLHTLKDCLLPEGSAQTRALVITRVMIRRISSLRMAQRDCEVSSKNYFNS